MLSQQALAEVIYRRMYDETYFDTEALGVHASLSEAFAEECAQVEKKLFMSAPELFIFEPGVAS